ncbi:hypothetical protein V1293_006471 [Bradyrhizobium sp. AZCC 1693]
MARGPACSRRTPHFSKTRFLRKRFRTKYQPACKPGSVGHHSLAQAIRDGHSSGTMFAHGLEQPTRTASLTSPCGVIAFANGPALPSLFGFAPGVVCHAVSVAGYAVRSYRTFSPLLRPETERFVLCGTFPGVAPAGRYPAPYVDGARTFLPRSLSTVAGAAVRPTDIIRMGALARRVKGPRWLIGFHARNFDRSVTGAFDAGSSI